MNKEIPLMLDSTVLKQVPKLNSQLFKELIKQVHIGAFKLYFSEVVENEYLTWIKDEAQQSYDNVVKATESLNKYHEKPDIFGMKLSINITADVAKNQINEVLKNVVSNWDDFKKSTNAIVLPIGSSHGSLVMSAYFNGDTPFKKVKNRSDIPDGFIYYSIVDLLKYNENVLFISGDKNLTKRMGSNRVICFESLSELFSSKEYGMPDDFFKTLEGTDREHFLFKYFSGEIQRQAIHQIELSDLVYGIEEELEDGAIGENSYVSSSVESISLDEKNIKVISKHCYILPFIANLSHLISSEASKDELSLISEERIMDLEKEIKDDGNFEISESHRNTVQGNLSVTFEDSNPLLWEEKKADTFLADPEFKEIDVALEDIKINA